jgi:hypothetical protein
MKLVCLRMSGLTPTYDVAAAKVVVVAIARCHMIGVLVHNISLFIVIFMRH